MKMIHFSVMGVVKTSSICLKKPPKKQKTKSKTCIKSVNILNRFLKLLFYGDPVLYMNRYKFIVHYRKYC